MIRKYILGIGTSSRQRVAGMLRNVAGLRDRIDRHALLISLIAFVVFSFAALMDSFGMDTATDRAVAKAAATLYGPFYGRHGGGGADREGQDRIVLALIDDESLHDLGSDGFPISYAGQLKILQTLASYHPAAIFVDMTYLRPRVADLDAYAIARLTGQAFAPPKDVVALADGIAAIEAQGVPVFTGPVAENDDLLSPLKSLHQVSLKLPVSGYYDFIYEYNGVPAKAGAPLPAAIALYQQLCETGRLRPSVDCAKSRRYLRGTDFYIQWGLGSSKRQLNRMPADERERCATTGSPWREVGKLITLGATRNMHEEYDDSSLADRCFYHDAFSVASLLSGNDANGPWQDVISGKVVLLGANTADSGDRWAVPFYKDTPGVAIHAMALDNLIEMQGKPPLVPGQIGPFDREDLLQVVTSAALLIVFFVLTRNRKLALTRPGPDGEPQLRRVTVGLVICMALLACGFILAVAIGAHWPMPFVLLNVIAPAGITAAGLLLIGRLSRPRPPDTYETGEEP